MTAEEVKNAIRNVPDFPVKGIQFKDITTALDKPECLKWMRDEIVKRYKGLGITQVVGIESRGFILAPAVAMEIGAGFVPIRKPNKLPAETVSVTYAKEYGEDTIQNSNKQYPPYRSDEFFIIILLQLIPHGNQILKIQLKCIFSAVLLYLNRRTPVSLYRNMHL